jgi:predicted AlkP superfamily pyrophosphatase or phosphodiesterase
MAWVAAAAFLGAAASAQASPVLLISLDGLRPTDVTPQRTPRLAALAREGARAQGVIGVLPTLTYPSHTTLMTGVAPERHGIGNNLTFDPLNRNQRGWYWYASDVKVPTLWQAAHAGGLHTANIHWPVSVGAPGIDANLPQIWRTGTDDDRKLMAALATPGLLPRLEAELGPYAQGEDETVEGDANRIRFAAKLLAEDKPALTTVYLAGIDHEEHRSGPGTPAALDTIARTDALVGTLIDAARQAMPEVTIAVVSDHGFAPVTTDINLFAPFIAAGLVTLGKDGSVAEWQAEPWVAGGTAAIRLARPDDDALVAKVRTLLDKLAADPAYHIERVLDRAAIEAAGGPAEASFVVAFPPGYETGIDPAAPTAKPSTYKGMHGYLPTLPAMRSTLIVAGPALARRGDLGQVDMRAIAPSLARILGVSLPQAEAKPVF